MKTFPQQNVDDANWTAVFSKKRSFIQIATYLGAIEAGSDLLIPQAELIHFFGCLLSSAVSLVSAVIMFYPFTIIPDIVPKDKMY